MNSYFSCPIIAPGAIIWISPGSLNLPFSLPTMGGGGVFVWGPNIVRVLMSSPKHYNAPIVCTHVTLEISSKFQNIQNSLISSIELICNIFCTSVGQICPQSWYPSDWSHFRTFHRENGMCMFEYRRCEELDLTHKNTTVFTTVDIYIFHINEKVALYNSLVYS